jgi:predicted nuclease of restriction endonuclease-like RecB superfamily
MYRSKFEKQVADVLGNNASYESETITYIIPERTSKYIPDFKTKAGVYIEAKGKWTSDDRKKHLLLKQQHPDKRIVLIFMNSKVKLNKRSKTSYGDWASKNNLEWYDFKSGIPLELYKKGRKNGD